MRIAVYAKNEVVGTDVPKQFMTRAKVECGVRDGLYVWLTHRTARHRHYVYDPEPKSLTFAQQKTWFNQGAETIKTAGVCQICGFSRFVERSHIIPRRFDGQAEPLNLLDLCPNHHSLFDANLLTWQEMQKIWPFVCERLITTLGDFRLNQWRIALTAKYGVSFDAS